MSEQMTEFQNNLVRMWDSMRESYKGVSRCSSVRCEACPLYECCYSNYGNTVFAVERIIEIVTQWAKEHPFVTVMDIFKEAFGVEPKNDCGTLICPHFVGFVDVECVYGVGYKDCKKCKEQFWHSEYREPKKEGE